MKRNSIVSFCVLAFVLGAGAIYLVVQGAVPPGLALASSLSPSVAGVILTAVAEGRDGLKRMFGRLLIWRVGVGYWLFALLFLTPVFMFGSLFNPIFGGDPFSLRSLQPGFAILPMSIAFFVAAGIGQELGWAGFLLPRLQARYSALTSCFIRAVLAGVWHLPLLLYSRRDLPALADFPYAGWIAQQGFLVTLAAMFCLFLLPWSIYFSWVFNNTRGSLLLVAVLHGSEIWLAYWMLRAGIDPRNLNNYWGYGAVLALIAILVVLLSGPQNLSRNHPRVVHPPRAE